MEEVKVATYKEKFDRLLAQHGIDASWFDRLLQRTKAVVAGSFTLKAYLLDGPIDVSEWDSDIDIWMSYQDEEQFHILVAELITHNFGLPKKISVFDEKTDYLRLRKEVFAIYGINSRNKRNNNYRLPNRTKVQIIRTLENPLVSIANFDIRVCSLAFNGQELVNERRWLEDIISDINNRRIVSMTHQSLRDWERTAARIGKYIVRGFVNVDLQSIASGIEWSIDRPEAWRLLYIPEEEKIHSRRAENEVNRADRHDEGYPGRIHNRDFRQLVWDDLGYAISDWNDKAVGIPEMPKFCFNDDYSLISFGFAGGNLVQINTASLGNVDLQEEYLENLPNNCNFMPIEEDYGDGDEKEDLDEEVDDIAAAMRESDFFYGRAKSRRAQSRENNENSDDLRRKSRFRKDQE
jgi:hypothetical protein